MPTAAERLTAGQVYHLYNRGIDRTTIFITAENCLHFLRCYHKHAHPWLETLAYCLMPCHFHVLVRVREGADALPPGRLLTLVEAGLRNCFIAYAKGINAECQRVGALFQYKFKRRRVAVDAYFTRLIHYLHANPVRAGLVARPTDWPYSSYRAYLSQRPTLLNRAEVLAWFGGAPAFARFALAMEGEAEVRRYLWQTR
jgi:REP element-mobilizing transposase RayT